MDEISKLAEFERPGLQTATDGEFAGWQTWISDNYENHTGPFWHRAEGEGRIRCAFRVEKKHLNSAGNVHGGVLMTFADYCLFAIASPVLQESCVTVSFSAEFLAAAREGELIEAAGNITRAGGSLIFVRGELTSAQRLLFTFSSTMKRVKRRPAPDRFVG
ncbi:PaaI family thioesterase [Bradyrhizobium brasilense]|uniref:PaaI family thioesterase n=1 Tax=Bradyrhizobium brasilense TaxID=1419277 RepID=UPI0014579317|nr:PaaI family thioesterase [Bradyrhizobium brasilense]NLS75354.1 PaaI family thioesterase [Bradyrhizobium brasilense]